MAKKKIETDDSVKSPLAEAFADFPNIDALTRRIDGGAMPASQPIRLIDEPTAKSDPGGTKRKWYVRWINTALPGRFHAITSGYAYVPVDWDELQHKDQISDKFEGLDRHVRRGDKGQDLLVKLPMAGYLQAKEAERTRADARNSPKSIKEQLQNEAALRLGQEASEGVGGLIGDVRELPSDALRGE